MKLHEIPRNQKIYAECQDGSTYIDFHHIDGMYSLCVSEKGNILHISAMTEVTEFKDGWKIVEEKDDE